MKYDLFVQEIEKAFQSVEYPGDDSIVVNTDIYQESYEMCLAFKGHWRDVSPEVVEEYRITLGRFTASGFCFYLPALLMAAIDPTPYEVDEWLIQNLSPPIDDERRKLFDKKMNLLSGNQKKVVKKFVDYFFVENPLFLDHHRNTLEYWNNVT